MLPGSTYSSVKPELLIAGPDHPSSARAAASTSNAKREKNKNGDGKGLFKVLTKQLLTAAVCELDEHSHTYTSSTTTIVVSSQNNTAPTEGVGASAGGRRARGTIHRLEEATL